MQEELDKVSLAEVLNVYKEISSIIGNEKNL